MELSSFAEQAACWRVDLSPLSCSTLRHILAHTTGHAAAFLKEEAQWLVSSF